ncbi:MAG: hypothetical protein NZ959_09940 [Armatimonadetes bacterium]|nr:hypothetical protein [Armatimonadota bacterium]MDW8122750.1 uroporphyrinogen decarboxylase family protein [Armatimonadota bacterium]
MNASCSFTPKERALAALTLSSPLPGKVPCFELEFQLAPELLGKDFHDPASFLSADPVTRERFIRENAELYVAVAERLDYCMILIVHAPDDATLSETVKAIRKLADDRYLLLAHGDATFAIPSGSDMEEVAAAFFEKPQEMHQLARDRVIWALERGHRLKESCGLDGLALCSDYCFNTGPFLSPKMFREFITPYLKDLVAGYKEQGFIVIKHTDGNIMPILDQLVECRPHGLHALDCQAREMDIATIKNRVGHQVCLLGGVQCSLLQTGTEEEIIAHCRYVLEKGMPGGGFIYGTTNVAFRGLPLERYLLMLWARDQWGYYREDGTPVAKDGTPLSPT